MKRYLVLWMSVILIVSVMATPVSAVGNGYRWHRTVGESESCGSGRTETCCCGQGPFGICDNGNADAATDTAMWGLRRCRNVDPNNEFERTNFADEDGDGLCDRCNRDNGKKEQSEDQSADEDHGVCDGTGPKGKGRDRKNR